jgi:hypothetical protein
LAKRHEVLPLVHAAIQRSELKVAPNYRAWLNRECQKITAHNLLLTAELVQLVEALEHAGVNAVCFKGPALTAAIYPSLSLRQIADLDLFIPKSDIREALKVLTDRGYLPGEKCGHAGRKDFRSMAKDIECFHPKTGAHLELHWSACEPFFDRKLALMDPCAKTSVTRVLGREVRVPATEELLILLALHGLRHRWDRLKWIFDIACFLRAHADIDWDSLLAKAERLSRVRMVLLAVLLANQIANCPIPPAVARRIQKQPILETLARQIRTGHGCFEEEASSFSRQAIEARGQVDRFRLQTRDKFLDRLALLWELFFERVKPTEEDRGWLSRPTRIFRVYGVGSAAGWLRQLLAAVSERRA